MSTVLVIGSGGREHALAWKLSTSKRVTRLIVAPGNDGMNDWARWPANFSQGPSEIREEFERLADRAVSEKVDLVVVGPDNPLADGIVDVFTAKGLPCFGPTAGAARIEASKAFAKEIMEAAGVPTARCFIVEGKDEARNTLRSLEWPEAGQPGGWVIKADGLALGKGVYVCSSLDEALRAVDALNPGKFVIEEKLQGEEISWMAFCDGKTCALLEPARDHKRLLDHDQGPNTGGMGAFTPVAGIPESWFDRVRKEVFLPTLQEMAKRGAPFKGLLYAGLMVDVKNDKIWVLEFNARFGDPETQALLPRMSDDLYLWCNAVARHDLSGLSDRVGFHPETVVAVVAAAKGYPDAPVKGATITGEKWQAPNCFYAGVVQRGGKLEVSGGRVLATVGSGADIEAARKAAYGKLKSVCFEGMQYRSDIGSDVGNGR
jgi:phosphoribosylamine--glycine ligase